MIVDVFEYRGATGGAILAVCDGRRELEVDMLFGECGTSRGEEDDMALGS